MYPNRPVSSVIFLPHDLYLGGALIPYYFFCGVFVHHEDFHVNELV